MDGDLQFFPARECVFHCSLSVLRQRKTWNLKIGAVGHSERTNTGAVVTAASSLTRLARSPTCNASLDVSRPVEIPNPVPGIRDLTNPESRGILETGFPGFSGFRGLIETSNFTIM